MRRKKITDEELRSIVDSEIKGSMGELGGELSHERTMAMDYYLGRSVGKLSQPNPDRSQVVITTGRDTVEWLLPQLMRLYAQADNVVEFEPVGLEDEKIAKQETNAINHIFWRQNEGFLILYSWLKDALTQKNGIVKFWAETTGDEVTEEYDGLTEQAIYNLIAGGEYEPIEQEMSEEISRDGRPLFHMRFRRLPHIRIMIEVLPPEEFIISPDARSVDIQTKPPRFVGDHSDKTEDELKNMGFTDTEIEDLGRGDERWDELGEEWSARYHLSDEKQHLFGWQPHDSLRKIKLFEGYMNIDMDGDGYAELIRVHRGGDHLSWEEVDSRPYAALTPNILTHKFFGQSIMDLIKDIQEIQTATMRNVLDNMYQVNNTRAIVNNRVDTDSLLVSRPGAPIYIDDSAPVDGAIQPFAPPAVWKDGLQVMEYMDGIRKDRTGVGDETMGLDPTTLATANTGVVLQAIEAATAKVELIARIFAETGIKWLFRGIHELCRKHYDQTLRYKLGNTYEQVNPQEWRERTNLTVNVGTGHGNRQQNLFALQMIGQIQKDMVQGGLMGRTVLPSNLYATAKEVAENFGKWGDKFFLNPKLLNDPQVQQIIQSQMPEPPPDPQTMAVHAMAQVEQMKAQVQREKTQAETQAKQLELGLKDKEIDSKERTEGAKAAHHKDIEDMKRVSEERTRQSKFALETVKSDMQMMVKQIENQTKLMTEEMKAEVLVFKTTTDALNEALKSQTEISSAQSSIIKDMQNRLDVYDEVISRFDQKSLKSQQIADKRVADIAEKILSENVLSMLDKRMLDFGNTITDRMEKKISESMLQNMLSMQERSSRPRKVNYDDSGRITTIE